MNRAGRLTAILLTVATLAAGCGRQTPDSPDSQNDHNKALARRWIEEGFNDRNLRVVDELFTEAFSVNGQVIGVDGLKQSMARHLRGFPDLHVTIDAAVAEGNTVGIWYTATGTHRGEFEAILPTGQPVKWSGFDLLTLEGGKFSSARFVSDHLGLLTQLGATITLPAAQDRK